MQENLKKIAEFILAEQKVAIISHQNPDGDTLGSQLALAMALEQKGIEVIMLNHDVISAKYNFIKNYERIVSGVLPEELPKVVIFVDCANITLTGYHEEEWLQDKIIVNIDHHTSNTQYGQYNYVQSKSGANCQNMYYLLQAMDTEFTPEISTALYMGLSTDTGNFLYESVSADTFRVAANLVEYGADTTKIRMNFYENCSRRKLELQKYIYNNLSFSADGRCAWSKLEWSLLEELQAVSTDIDGLINSIKDIEGVEVALLFKENATGMIKVSLRSKTWADVNAIANKLGGGGHVRAAGCSLNVSMEEAQRLFVEATEEYLAKGGE